MHVKASLSEDHGLAALSDHDLQIYSVGISTGGVAEIRMAEDNQKRHITATTIDEKGIAFAKAQIVQRGLQDRIVAKIEDVAQPLPYPDSQFDYIYARLVLHYLSKDKLPEALHELHRVLKPGGKLYVVVRSDQCLDANRPEAAYDPQTHLTSGTFIDKKTGKSYSYRRFYNQLQQSLRRTPFCGLYAQRTFARNR